MKNMDNRIYNYKESEINKFSFSTKYVPIILIEIYLWLGYFLYRVGAYVWPFSNDRKTLLFLILANLMLVIGYCVAVKLNSKNEKQRGIIIISPNKVLLICCCIALICYIPMCRVYTGYWYPPFLEMIADPQEMYYRLLHAQSNKSTNFLGLFEVFIFSILPLAVYYWDDLKKSLRYVSLGISVLYLFLYMSCTRNITVFLQVIAVFSVFITVLLLPKEKKTKRRVIRTLIIFVMFITLMLVFFKFNISSRTGYSNDVETKVEQETESTKENNTKENNEQDVYRNYNGLIITKEQYNNYKLVKNAYPIYTFEYSKAYVNIWSGLYSKLPESLKFLYVSITGYLTNGYNGLTVALHTDHVWTYGLGYSSFLRDYAKSLFGINAEKNTYWYRIKHLDKPLLSSSDWPSGYSQWADDLTFP